MAKLKTLFLMENNYMRRTFLGSGLFVLLLACSGCGSSVKLYPVSGTITYKNVAVQGADVTLIPVDDAAGLKPARGTTDASGRFTVQTYFAPGDDRRGALAGLYKVTVQKFPAADGIVDPYKAGGPPKNELPAKYASALQTPLDKEVSAGGTNEIVQDLRD